eukprot:scaffold25472_cov60-Phaeocystis_antarctica.AAC.1
MHVCILNVSWSVKVVYPPVRAPRGAPGPGPRGRRARRGGRPVPRPAGRARVRVISSRERVAGAQGRISHRADCAYRLQYSETRDTPHTLSPAGRAFGLLFRLQRAVRGGPCGNAASAALLACA